VFYYYAVDATFKAIVDAYSTPVSGNAINSPRIQDLSDALAAGVAADVWTAVAALDALDQGYLADHAASQPLWDQAQAALSAADYTRFQNEVGQAVAGPYIDSYTVVKGDTLYDIADRILYNASRWEEIYKMNKGVIGNNPNRIKEGTRLVLPLP
jgi:nucleoid-associated protein YgaU